MSTLLVSNHLLFALFTNLLCLRTKNQPLRTFSANSAIALKKYKTNPIELAQTPIFSLKMRKILKIRNLKMKKRTQSEGTTIIKNILYIL